jgi:DNA-directed RNA polymerase subunit RPC12/RpoP
MIYGKEKFMASLQDYKCPACGGAIEFNSKLQKVKCPYCDTEFELEVFEAMDEQPQDNSNKELAWDTDPGGEWADGEQNNMFVYTCKSCGGEIVVDENTGATKCPYCDSPVILRGKFSGGLRPDYVIPFQLDKNAAKTSLLNHFKGKKLLPTVFKDEHHIDEIKGVYVPFWLFDADADADIQYRATKTRMWSDSDYDYTETKFYHVYRSGHLAFQNIPVDGSTQMPDDLMESIEPFDFSKAVDFKTAYLAGYLADKYDVSADQSVKRANTRVRKSAEEVLKESVVGYTSVTPEQTNISLKSGTAKYALYPVWILNTTWNGEKYTFAMNGQTGKFVGNLPLDKAAYTKSLVVSSILFSLIAYIIVCIINWI